MSGASSRFLPSMTPLPSLEPDFLAVTILSVEKQTHRLSSWQKLQTRFNRHSSRKQLRPIGLRIWSSICRLLWVFPSPSRMVMFKFGRSPYCLVGEPWLAAPSRTGSGPCRRAGARSWPRRSWQAYGQGAAQAQGRPSEKSRGAGSRGQCRRRRPPGVTAGPGHR